MNGKKVLVLGFSKSGIAAAKLAQKRGYDVYLSESKSFNPEKNDKVNELKNLGIKIEFDGHSSEFTKNVDFVITSPGIPPHSEILTTLRNNGIEIISELEFAYKNTKTPFIIITGTNGKTTTTALTQYIFNKKFNSKACGNIGFPPSEIVDENLDYLVCEASSYQLEMTKDLRPLISVWTNFTPDHIDWHGGLENYFRAKAKVFVGNQTPKFAVLNATDEKLFEFGKNLNTTVFYFGKNYSPNCCYIEDDVLFFKENEKTEKIIELSQIPIIGMHNYQNVMCSVICAKLVGMDNSTIKDAIMEFRAPEHRLEKIAVKDCNIEFYNDSKATNPEAAIVAIDSFNNKDVVLIAGGRDKNTDLAEFCNSVKKHIHNVILIGEATERFETNLKSSGFENIIKEETLESAVDRAILLNPEVVLLSPACASFDMFTSYENRGEVFKNYVLSRL